MCPIPITAEAARAKVLFARTPESDLKNLLANINERILRAAYQGNYFVSLPKIIIDTELNLKENMCEALHKAGFDVIENDERMYIFWAVDTTYMKEILNRTLKIVSEKYGYSATFLCKIYDMNKELYYRMLIESNVIDSNFQPTEKFADRGFKLINEEIYVTDEALPYIFRLFQKYEIRMRNDVEMTEDVINYLRLRINEAIKRFPLTDLI